MVLVHDPQSNGSTQSNSMFSSRLNLHSVFLISWGRYGTLTGSAACQLRLDVGLCEFEERRNAIDNGANGLAMAFAISGEI